MIIDAKIHNEERYRENSVIGAIAHAMLKLAQSDEHKLKIDNAVDKHGFTIDFSTFSSSFYQVKKTHKLFNLHLKYRRDAIYIFKKSNAIKFVPCGVDGVIEEKIRESGKQGITGKDLYRKTRQIHKDVRSSILSELIGKKIIAMKKICTSGSKKPTMRFFIL